jgi:hypothetical protein
MPYDKFAKSSYICNTSISKIWEDVYRCLFGISIMNITAYASSRKRNKLFLSNSNKHTLPEIVSLTWGKSWADRNSIFCRELALSSRQITYFCHELGLSSRKIAYFDLERMGNSLFCCEYFFSWRQTALFSSQNIFIAFSCNFFHTLYSFYYPCTTWGTPC